MNKAETLRHLVRRSRDVLGVPAADRLPELNRRIGLLEERESAIQECALIVVLLGGTKVGKTTLINALAGKVIGEISSKACFTSRPAVFVHRNREAVARTRLAGVLSPQDRVEIHEEEALEGIILVDTPDFDGIEAHHQEIFHQVLERADLALCVVTTQKYDDRELFQVLGQAMGFRRTAVVFNRTDEGIPLTPAIKEDFARKFAAFQLKPPEGQVLPIFAISALNALLRKLGQGKGAEGEFAGLEALLRERLDGELIRKISEENFAVFHAETTRFVRDECRISRAAEALPALMKTGEHALTLLEQRGGEITTTMLAAVVEELLRRRAQKAAEHLGGPFGAYMRLSLAIRGLSAGLFSPVAGTEADPATGMSDRLVAAHQQVFAEVKESFRRQVQETADAFDLGDLAIAGASMETLRGSRLSPELRKCLTAPVMTTTKSFLYNLLPIVIILLLVRYFVISLLTIHEPSAGMFIGGGMMLWLACHLQGVFWLNGVSGDAETLHREIRTVFLEEARRVFVQPLLSWDSSRQKLDEEFRKATPS